jgi:streptogrisin C
VRPHDRRPFRRLALLSSFSIFIAAEAPPPVVVPAPPADTTTVQTPMEALIQDATEYARQYDVSLVEGMRRLRALQESVATTDRLAQTYKARLAGISIEHRPAFRIVVLLTGSEPVADESLFVGDMAVPIQFRTGAAATREQIVAAIYQHQAVIKSALPQARGMGADARTGELVVMIDAESDDLADQEDDRAKLAALTGVPVRLQFLDRSDVNSLLAGGGRATGTDSVSGKRDLCTTGFVVTDGARTGIATAAHCPHDLVYRDPTAGPIALSFISSWGARYQDVQIFVSDHVQAPLFYTDRAKAVARLVQSWRNRDSTRGGDFVCHRGEGSGYGCAEVALVDYAPPGTLCGGPCEPRWVTVEGPSCAGGDSGGPVFSGGIAFGIFKGANYDRHKRCNFYFYMSTDYLPPGWRLLYR